MNERIIEVHDLLHFLMGKRIKSILDVGAHGSPYLKLLKQLSFDVTGVDIHDDPNKVIDKFLVGNVLDVEVENHDLVTCISTIEHAGVSNYKVDDVAGEQARVFEKLVSLADKYLYITYPIGLAGEVEGQYTNITAKQHFRFTQFLDGWKWRERFYYNMDPRTSANQWKEIEGPEARYIPLDKLFGVQSICIITAQK